jgi:hypothetical protein
MEKPVSGEQVQIATVGFQGIQKRALAQANLGQGERLDPRLDTLLAGWFISHSGRNDGTDLRGTCKNAIAQ